LQAILETRPADEWLPALHAEEIPSGPINTAAEALNDAHARARGMIVEIEHPLLGIARSVGNPIHLGATPVTYRRHPPMLGEQTDEILHELGKNEAEIDELKNGGVI
jgi:crotonobetainyl-CoA:carnitine CoA-transferase CaiB-like acyl-CoA transferase